MRQQFTAQPGSSLQSIALSNSAYITGVQIDNPSGGWLYIVEAKEYVHPYTNGWTTNLPFASTSLTIQWGISPSGQQSTAQGDPYSVWLDSESVAQANPDRTITDFTQTFVLLEAQTFTLGVPASSVSPSIVISNSRFRVTQLFLSMGGAQQAGNIYQLVPSPCTMIVELWLDNYGGGFNYPEYILRVAGTKVHDELVLTPWLNTSNLAGGLKVTFQFLNPAYLDPTLFLGSALSTTVVFNGGIIYQVF